METLRNVLKTTRRRKIPQKETFTCASACLACVSLIIHMKMYLPYSDNSTHCRNLCCWRRATTTTTTKQQKCGGHQRYTFSTANIRCLSSSFALILSQIIYKYFSVLFFVWSDGFWMFVVVLFVAGMPFSGVSFLFFLFSIYFPKNIKHNIMYTL